MGKKVIGSRLSREQVKQTMHSLPVRDGWAIKAKGLIELSMVTADTNQDVPTLRGIAIHCRQQADELRSTKYGKSFATQQAALSLIEMSTQLEERACELDVLKAQPVANLENTKTEEGENAMKSNRPTDPGAPPPPAGNTTQQMGSVAPPAVVTPEPSMSSALEEGLNPNLETVDNDGLVEPLSEGELRSMKSYLSIPIERWSMSSHHAVWKLCFPSGGQAGHRSGCVEELVTRYHEAVKWRANKIRELAEIPGEYSVAEVELINQLLGHRQPRNNPDQFIERSFASRQEEEEMYLVFRIHAHWYAQRLLNQTKLWTKADHDWIRRYERDIPKHLLKLLIERYQRETAPDVAPSVKTAIIPVIVAAAQAVTAPDAQPSTDEPPAPPATDVAPATSNEDADAEERSDFADTDRHSTPPVQKDVVPQEQTELVPPTKVASNKPVVILIGLITLVLAAFFGAISYHLFGARQNQPTVAQTGTVPVPAVTPPTPAIVQPVPQPIVEEEILRDLQPSDVGVEDLTRVRDGQIPSAIRFEHLRCRPSPSRNADGITIDFSHCKWREVRTISQPTSGSTTPSTGGRAMINA